MVNEEARIGSDDLIELEMKGESASERLSNEQSESESDISNKC
jgi:hypothetical protein